MSSIDSLIGAYTNLSTSATSVLPRVSKEEEDRIQRHYNNQIAEGKRISESSRDYWRPSVYNAELFGTVIPTSAAELRKPSKVDRAKSDMRITVEIAKYPFSKGTLRAAYYGKVNFDGTKSDVVLKEFMIDSDRTEKEYKNQSENSAVAHFLITEYSKTHSLTKPVKVVKSRILKVNIDGKTTLFNMEERLSGEFKKWTNNAGNILERNDDLFRFSNWTHTYSSSYLLLADIQGVESSSQIVLTDPAILCTDTTRFGPTNFHPSQITVCLEGLQHALRGGVATAAALDTISIRRPGFSHTADAAALAFFHRVGALRKRETEEAKKREIEEIIEKSQNWRSDSSALYYLKSKAAAGNRYAKWALLPIKEFGENPERVSIDEPRMTEAHEEAEAMFHWLEEKDDPELFKYKLYFRGNYERCVRKNYTVALLCYTQSEAMGNSYATLGVGLTYYYMKNATQALSYLEKSLSLHDLAFTRSCRGSTLLVLNRFSEAINDFRRTEEISFSRLGLGMYYAGDNDANNVNADLAYHYLQKFADEEGDKLALYFLGSMLVKIGKLNEGKAYLHKSASRGFVDALTALRNLEEKNVKYVKLTFF